ncbi:MAG: phage holin family protein [Chloroflexota bacterium]|nr:phage holin family protein [Chloroflexota bacterium]PLS80466.1 MAG: phage holin family protein [Chloroflexota bacterium]
MIGQFNLKRFVLNLAINIIAILLAVRLVPGIELSGPWWGLAVVALLFGLINTSIRPLLLLLALPVVVLTLGFFMLLINAAMLYLTSWLAEGFGITFSIESPLSAIVGAVLISLVSTLLSILSGENRVQFQVIRGRRDE